MRIWNLPFSLCSTVGVLLLASISGIFVIEGASDAKPADLETGLQTKVSAQLPEAPPNLGPDDRFKADILLIVPHPDDESATSGYLARAIYDEHKRVSVLFTTRSEGGGNAVGLEQGTALGAVREIEARQALASLGVMNVWFLYGRDNAGQDVFFSLENGNHGALLEKTIRFVRLTRPEVILTWIPDYVAGENHGDHQAAGVIATEAFDLAGDPTAFPEQLSAPRDPEGINNMVEGLRPWQPKKIYYFSDTYTSHTDFLKGKGPQYSTIDISPTRQTSYARLAAEAEAFHSTQEGEEFKKALAKGDIKSFQEPVRFVFGKSLVKSSSTGDIFEGIRPGPIPFASIPGYQSESRQGLWIELGGPWALYRVFWKAHNIGHLSGLLQQPEVSVRPGETMHLPLLIHNDTGTQAQVPLTITLPEGWKALSGEARYTVAAHDIYPVQTVLVAPGVRNDIPQEVTWKAEANGRTMGTVTIRVYVIDDAMPQ